MQQDYNHSVEHFDILMSNASNHHENDSSDGCYTDKVKNMQVHIDIKLKNTALERTVNMYRTNNSL